MKMRHDPSNIIPPKAKTAIVAASVALVAAVSVSAPATTSAMKMHHDCCVYTPTTTK